MSDIPVNLDSLVSALEDDSVYVQVRFSNNHIITTYDNDPNIVIDYYDDGPDWPDDLDAELQEFSIVHNKGQGVPQEDYERIVRSFGIEPYEDDSLIENTAYETGNVEVQIVTSSANNTFEFWIGEVEEITTFNIEE